MMSSSKESRIRLVLRAGSIVFGLSAITLIAVPSFFNELLGLEATPALDWAMRMIGVTLFALAGNMFSVSTRGSEKSVLFSGKVMIVAHPLDSRNLGLVHNSLRLRWFRVLTCLRNCISKKINTFRAEFSAPARR
jgi:hypothetical protein